MERADGDSSPGTKMENGVRSQMNFGNEKKLPYPKSVFFIISNEFCERFSYYGMRTVLALYLTTLGYSEDMSTIVYHFFIMLCYFTPLFGGIMADAWLGKFKTILYVSMVYAAGNIVLSLGSVHVLSLPHREMSLLGLLLIAIGTGGIKPCVSSFGGDQFVVPQQQRQLQQFFSVFYFSINAGSVLSTFLTPILREIKCLGSEEDCYPLAFGLPAVLMVVALVLFVLGSPLYKMKKPEGNIALDVSGCISRAIVRKVGMKHKRDHWLDYADDKYSPKLVEDVKVLMSLVYLFAPTIVFWALFEQQGSRWTFQANRMDGDIGWFVIQPDQMQTLNPVLCLVFIPLFESALYPLLAKLRIVRTPLQKLSAGGLLAALAFFVSGILQLKIQSESPVLPSSGQSGLRLYNGLDCPGHISDLVTADLPALSSLYLQDLSPKQAQIAINTTCGSYTGSVNLIDAEISSYLLLKETSGSLSLHLLNATGKSEIEKSSSNVPKIKFIYSGMNNIKVALDQTSTTVSIDAGKHQSEIKDVAVPGKYSVTVDGQKLDSEVELRSGGVYSVLLGENSGKMAIREFTLTHPNSISILWQLPQYFIMTTAEIMFSVTGLEFSYSQSPVSMKSVISSLWLLTDSLGNIIVLVIAGIKMSNQAYEMFLFAGLMSVVMVLFIYLAIGYKYVTYEQGHDEDSKDTDE